MNTRAIHSIGMEADVLMAFNQEAVDVWGDRLVPGGLLLYDPKYCQIPDDYPFKQFAVPLHDTAMGETGARIAKNVVALAALLKILGIPPEETRELISSRFKHKGEEVVEKNSRAFDAGLALMDEAPNLQVYVLEKPDARAENKIIISGNQALSMGAIAGGCRFVAGYPITPATPILEFMMKYLPGFGGNVVQAEDEIAAISSCLGASYTGARAMTATSGPGLCLMSELIGLASMSEIPVVIVDVQRSGPGTGMPTKTEQSDLMYALYGTAGEAPRIVIAPTSIEDCYYQAIQAFNLAERYQVPVIVLSDQSMAYRTQSLDIPDTGGLTIEGRELVGEEAMETYRRYRNTASGVSPMTIPGMRNGMYVATGLEHDETGAPSYTTDNRERMMAKRYRKLDTLSAELDANGNGTCDSPQGAEVGIIGWGSTEGPIREAISRAEADGARIAHLQPKVLMPLARKKIEGFLKPLKKVIVFEENHTKQFSSYLKSNFAMAPIEVNKCTGMPFSGDEVFASLQEHV
ncbi:MAG: 2-oxoacid:acceptor oxidoreductase subunit alpha, partial [Candidatus Krumholzibacteria bacterium]|nr:2-oxoacid:acceptor oxidoreductase subunit alpha [Candidatus Krumholzibacteria bacterium]